jgi:DNA-binding MarR family transcriptional regulator
LCIYNLGGRDGRPVTNRTELRAALPGAGDLLPELGPRQGWGSATIVGLFILGAVAAALLVAAELARREPLIDVRFFRSAPFAGASVIAAVLLARLTAHTPVSYLVLAYVIFGIGSGLVAAPITSTAVSGMPTEQAGVAGAIASTGRQVGSSLGVAVTGSIVATTVSASFVAASHAAWLVIAGCGLVVLVVGLVSTGPGRSAPRPAPASGSSRSRRKAPMTDQPPPPADQVPPDQVPPGQAPAAQMPADQASRVWALMQAFVTSQARNRELRDAFDFGRGMGRVTLLLKLTEGPLTLREIAESQGVDAPYATVIVDKLVDRGLAQRTPHPDDNRRKLVTLTDAGWDAATLAQGILARPPAAVADLPDADLAALDEILSRLSQPAKGPAGDRPGPGAHLTTGTAGTSR